MGLPGVTVSVGSLACCAPARCWAGGLQSCCLLLVGHPTPAHFLLTLSWLVGKPCCEGQ